MFNRKNMKEFKTIRINFLGGIASPGELRDIMSALKACQVQNVKFGLRQQMIFQLPVQSGERFEQRMKAIKVDYYVDQNPHPNVVSSYVAEEVFQQGNWLSEGIYKDVFDAFDFNPRIKINISDAQQSFSPFFSGHINFISSDEPNFWHLYVRIPKTNEIVKSDRLLFSNELASISKYLERRLLAGQKENLFEGLPVAISMPAEKDLHLPRFTLPYYEGFNRYGKKTWLGIYRREELFNVEFLLDLSNLCLNTKIGEICLTPWKSIIVKNISEKERTAWSSLLARHDINVRHAANELNWQIEDDSPEAMKLKTRLVDYFNQKDLRTFGICLGIKTVPKTEVFASVMVLQRKWKFLPMLKYYDITYTTDYDPNGREVAYFSKGIPGFMLPEKLREAVLQFNQYISINLFAEQYTEQERSAEPVKKNQPVHQCSSCLTVYDPEFGDELNGIHPGVAFDDLPASYSCSICGSEKEQFKEIILTYA